MHLPAPAGRPRAIVYAASPTWWARDRLWAACLRGRRRGVVFVSVGIFAARSDAFGPGYTNPQATSSSVPAHAVRGIDDRVHA
jgi:hypothetical protein